MNNNKEKTGIDATFDILSDIKEFDEIEQKPEIKEIEEKIKPLVVKDITENNIENTAEYKLKNLSPSILVNARRRKVQQTFQIKESNLEYMETIIRHGKEKGNKLSKGVIVNYCLDKVLPEILKEFK